MLLSLSITPSIDWWSCISQPGSVHWGRCLEFSCLHPHWGHLLSTLSSPSDNFELHPHQLETCFVTNVRKVLGYPAIAFFYLSHQIESKCAANPIFFLWKNFFAIDCPQNYSSSTLGDPVIFLPHISIQTSSLGKSLSINLSVLWAALKDFFARASTLIFICSFSVQSCHFFESSVWGWMYLYFTVKVLRQNKVLKMRRRLACVWFVCNEMWGVFPCVMMSLLLQSALMLRIFPLYPVAAAFSINCVIMPPNIYPW